MMKNKLFLLLLLGCFLSAFSLTAQTTKVTGVVKDDKGEPLPGATVQIVGTTKGTITDSNGNFTIEAAPKDVLKFNFVGFDPFKVTVGKQTVETVLEVSLTTGNVLDEVVVSGYGIETIRRDATGASSKIDKASLESTAPVSITEIIQGRAAGVNITSSDGTPGAGASINIRGFSSLSAGTSPLIVIDNVPYTINSSDATNPLATLNPNDIQSIDILKDASATALYGVGGSNGVIVVTTKKGQKGKPRINFSAKRGVGQIANRLPIMSPREYALYRAARVRAEAGDVGGLIGNVPFPGQPGAWELIANPTGTNIDTDPIKLLADQYGMTNPEGTSWIDLISRDAQKGFYDLNFSGATDAGTSYFGSLGYTSEEGMIIKSNYKRLSGLLNLEQKLGRMLTASIKLQYTNSNYGGSVGDWRGENAIGQVVFLNPFINRDNIVGTAGGLANNGGQGVQLENPEYRLKNLVANRGSDWLAGNFNLSFKPREWLEFAVNAGLITENSNRENYAPSFLREAQDVKGRITLETRRDNRIVIQPRVAFNKKYKSGHSFNATFIFEARKETQAAISTRYEQFNTEVLKQSSIAAAKNIAATPNFQDKRDRSYIGRIQYGYKSRYIFTASTRVDESSRFLNDRQGIFPAVSVAWNATEEAFMKPFQKVLSTFKVRAGYGITGNNQIPVNAAVSLGNLNNISNTINNGLNTAVNPSPRFANPDITWETTKGLNLGIDAGFLQDRFTLTTNFYRNLTTGLLLDIQLPAFSAFSNAIQNLGSLENRGLEFEVVSRNVKNKRFTWTTNFNISFNQNKILDLGGQPEIGFRNFGTGATPNDAILRVGKPIGVYYGVIQSGLINNDVERFNSTQKIQDNNTGEFDYFDIDGNGIIERTEYVPMAYTLPIHTGGIGNTVSYKGFELYAFMRWSYGNDVINNNINKAHYLRGDLNVQRNVVNDIWNRQDENRNYQSYSSIFTTRVGSLISRSEMVEDGSFIRLETVRLGYSVPPKLLRKYKVGTMRVYLTGQNLALLSRYSWYDPEVNVASGNNRQLFPGVDQGAYPRTRTILAGFDLSF
jgi:TonB-dependent starch-binding outer membrane protein SusC